MKLAGAAVGIQGRVAVALTGVGEDLGVAARAVVRTRESQPYHDAKSLPLDEAERLIAAASEAAAERATGDLRRLVEELSTRGLEVKRAGLVARRYRLPETLAATLRSHPSCHAAEGQMTVDALIEACNRLRIHIVAMPEPSIDPRVEQVGKLIGPPWRKEHKIAATARCGPSQLDDDKGRLDEQPTGGPHGEPAGLDGTPRRGDPGIGDAREQVRR